MEFRFEQTKADVLALNRHIILRRRVSWFVIALYPIGVAYYLRAADPVAILGYAALAFVLMGVFLFGLAFLIAYGRLSSGKYAAFLGPRRLRLDESGLELEANDSRSTLGWGAVLKAVQTRDHWFLFLTPQNALIVPRRAFRDDEERLRFEQLVRAHAGKKP